MIKVLLAEDIEILRENLVQKLNLEGDIIVVGACDSGREVVEMAKTIQFDVVILDIEMETAKAGIVAAGEILAIKEDAKIIFLSIHEDDLTILSAMDRGAVDYVVKSEKVEVVAEHIRNAHAEKVLMDSVIKNVVSNEYNRLKKAEIGLLFFIKNIAILTPTEKSLLKLLLERKTINQIAKIRFVEVVTIKTQIGSILKKLNVSRTKEIVKKIEEFQLEGLFLDY